MTPRALMITGAAMGLFGATVAIVRSDVGQFAVFLFAAGAVFGKGYGVYEERTRGAVRRRIGEADVRGMQIALDQAWESNRERQVEIARLRAELDNATGKLSGEEKQREAYAAILRAQADRPIGIRPGKRPTRTTTGAASLSASRATVPPTNEGHEHD